MQSATIRNAFVYMNRLHGDVYGHPKHTDGTIIHTGPITKRSRLGNVVYTVNTVYTVFWKRGGRRK